VAKLYDYRDFAHFIEVWILTTNALRTRDDFRQVVVAYADAATLGADPEAAFEAGIAGALCDGAIKERLRRIGEDYDWRSLL
jgi:hypothetical protein